MSTVRNTSCILPPLDPVHLASWQFIIPTVILATLNIIVIVGNILVVVAVATTKKLRTVTNNFIVSLAVADFMVGVMVLPFSNANEVLTYWIFGPVWCSVYLAVDVWFSTASIMNLVAISLDRYLAISHPFRYHDMMTPRRGKLLVAGVWLVSFIICFPPLLGLVDGRSSNNASEASTYNESASSTYNATPNDLPANGPFTNPPPSKTYIANIESQEARFFHNNSYTIHSECQNTTSIFPNCTLTSDPVYIVYSAMGSFYIPMVFLVFFYARIYHIAVRTTNSLNSGMLKIKASGDRHMKKGSETPIEIRVHRGGGASRPYGGGVPASTGHHTSFSSTTGSILYTKSSSSLKNVPEEGRLHAHSPKTRKHSSEDVMNERSDRIVLPRRISKRSSCSSNSPLFPASSTPRPSVSSARSSRFSLYSQSSVETVVSHNDRPPLARCTSMDSTVQAFHNKTSSFIKPRRLSSRMSKRSFDDLLAQAHAATTEGEVGNTKSNKKQHIISKRDIKRALKSLNKEKKAAKTVGIIIGCFIFCWLPFFTIYIFGAFCENCTSDLVFSIFFWLGYCNSAINPFIYAYFSRDFRFAFKRLLSCRCTFEDHTRMAAIMALFNGFRFNHPTRGSDSNSE